MDAVAHAPRGDGKHPPQLAAAEHADRRAGKDGRGQGSVSPNILCVCSARNWCSLFAQLWMVGGEDGDGQKRSVGRPRLADGERADGDAGGHLHDREE